MVPPVSNVRALMSFKVNDKIHLPLLVRAHCEQDIVGTLCSLFK